MTNQIAIALFLLICTVFAADQIWFGGTLPLTAARGLDDLIEYLAFWR